MDKFLEVAKEIVMEFVDSGHIYDEEFEKVIRAFTKALRQTRKEALEEAAKVAEDHINKRDFGSFEGKEIAKAIRTLANMNPTHD